MSAQPHSRYGEAPARRIALAPGLLAAIVLLVGLALLDTGTFVVILYLTSILALIVGYFAIQAKHWWWLPPLAAIAVIWNPVFPLGWSGPLWLGAQYLAILVFVLAGVLIKVRVATRDDARTDSQARGR